VTDNDAPQQKPTRPPRRRGPDIVTLVAGSIALVISAYVVLDRAGGWDLRWTLAIGAVSAGVIILIASLRTHRER
jgi:hypothetical protein